MESPSYRRRSQAPSCEAASSASSRTGRRVASTTWWWPTTRQMGRPSYRGQGVSATFDRRIAAIEDRVPRLAVGRLFPVLADAARQRRPRDPVIGDEAIAVLDLRLQHERLTL